MTDVPIDVTKCPRCDQIGTYEQRVLINGRGFYTCPGGHRWQDANEKPSTKGYVLVSPPAAEQNAQATWPERNVPLHAWQVEALAEGVQVTVMWSGGNGPHEYVVSVGRNGERYVWDGKSERLRFYNPLTFVGQERFHTRVWLGHGVTVQKAGEGRG